MRRSLLALVLAILGAGASLTCGRRKAQERSDAVAVASVHTDAAPQASAQGSSSMAPLTLERFVAARAVGDDVLLAAVSRARQVLLARLNGQLQPQRVDVLASDFLATDFTDVELYGSHTVRVRGRFADRAGDWLLRPSHAPVAVTGGSVCDVRDGVAWLQREALRARVHVWSAEAAPRFLDLPMKEELESSLSCNDDALALLLSEGESLQLLPLGRAAALSTGPAATLHKEGDAPAELREWRLLSRGATSVLLRLDGKGLYVQELGASAVPASPDAAEGARPMVGPFPIDLATDLVDAIAAPVAGGPLWVLLSEELPQASCGDDEHPRRIVLHALRAEGSRLVDRAQPVVELPCGTNAIEAHLQLFEDAAHIWWAEPPAAARCAEAGLAAGALLTFRSDRPGVRRTELLAEALARIDRRRFLAVVRKGGCVPYATEGNGALQLLTLPD